jgi:hypothetical protein
MRPGCPRRDRRREGERIRRAGGGRVAKRVVFSSTMWDVSLAEKMGCFLKKKKEATTVLFFF